MENDAKFWVLGFGKDCDGYNYGYVATYLTKEEAIHSAYESNVSSDGIFYYATDKIGDMIEYCSDYKLDFNNYLTK